MTKSEILKHYGVVISTPLHYQFYNRIDTVNEIMSCVLEFHHNLYRAKALVDGINIILNDQDNDEADFYTNNTELARVTKTNSYFYGDSDAYADNTSISPDYTMPTSDFLVIAQTWLDYLLKSPTTPAGPPYPPAN